MAAGYMIVVLHTHMSCPQVTNFIMRQFVRKGSAVYENLAHSLRKMADPGNTVFSLLSWEKLGTMHVPCRGCLAELYSM